VRRTATLAAAPAVVAGAIEILDVGVALIEVVVHIAAAVRAPLYSTPIYFFFSLQTFFHPFHFPLC
jgi:hypothetical protein